MNLRIRDRLVVDARANLPNAEVQNERRLEVADFLEALQETDVFSTPGDDTLARDSTRRVPVVRRISFAEDSFLNSVGIAILLDSILPLKDQGKEIRIVHPSKHFRRVFQIVGLSRDVPVYESEEAASAALLISSESDTSIVLSSP